jgi:hypothetical protein
MLVDTRDRREAWMEGSNGLKLARATETMAVPLENACAIKNPYVLVETGQAIFTNTGCSLSSQDEA